MNLNKNEVKALLRSMKNRADKMKRSFSKERSNIDDRLTREELEYEYDYDGLDQDLDLNDDYIFRTPVNTTKNLKSKHSHTKSANFSNSWKANKDKPEPEEVKKESPSKMKIIYRFFKN